jgi:hypothetical protein
MFSLKIGRVLIGALTVVLAFSVTGESQAWPTKKKGKGPVIKMSINKNYSNYSAKNYSWRGPHHRWSFSRYYVDYGCTLYYDADTGTYYYWCRPDGCFYPLGYCPYDRYSWPE